MVHLQCTGLSVEALFKAAVTGLELVPVKGSNAAACVPVAPCWSATKCSSVHSIVQRSSSCRLASAGSAQKPGTGASCAS